MESFLAELILVSNNHKLNVIEQLYKFKKKLSKNNIFVSFYIFGSFLNNKNPNDLDLLIIYENLTDTSLIRKKIKEIPIYETIELYFMYAIEEAELSFIKITNAKEIDYLFTYCGISDEP